MSILGFLPHARTQITGLTAGTWNRNIDVDSVAGVTVPAGATSVVLEVKNTSGSGYSFGAQKAGLGEDLLSSATGTYRATVFIPLADGNLIDLNIQNASIQVFVVGFHNRITHLSAAVDLSDQVTSTSTSGHVVTAWATSAKTETVPAEAAFALIEVRANADNQSKIYATGGVTTAIPGLKNVVSHHVVPLDSSKQFGIRVNIVPGANTYRLLGWLPAGFYSHVSAPTARKAAAINTEYTFPDSASGMSLACFIPAPGGGSYNYNFRKNASAAAVNGRPDTIQWCEPDTDGSVLYTQSNITGAYAYALVGGFTNQTSVTISGVDDSTPNHLGSLIITGSGFGATQGTGGITIGGVSQTVTSWSDTSITITVDRGTNMYGLALDLVVTNADSVASSAYSVMLYPQAGWDYLIVGTPNTTASNRITSIPDAATGNYFEWDTKSGDVVVYDDLTFSSAPAINSFDCTLGVLAEGWGTTGTQTIGSGGAVAPVLSSISANVDGSTINWTVTTDTSGGSLKILASVNPTETASTIKTNGVSHTVVSSGSQSGELTGVADGSWYIHIVHVHDLDSNVISTNDPVEIEVNIIPQPVLTEVVSKVFTPAKIEVFSKSIH